MEVAQISNLFFCLSSQAIVSLTTLALPIFPTQVHRPEKGDEDNSASCGKVERVAFVEIGCVGR
jgi:hypothetical protein